jgi:hypothetical protein
MFNRMLSGEKEKSCLFGKAELFAALFIVGSRWQLCEVKSTALSKIMCDERLNSKSVAQFGMSAGEARNRDSALKALRIRRTFFDNEAIGLRHIGGHKIDPT